MSEIIESEFGEIVVSRRRSASRVSLRMATDGRLKLTAPAGTPLLFLKAFLKKSRAEIAKIVVAHRSQKTYQAGAVIGKTHLLKLEYDASLTDCQVKIRPNFLVVRLPFELKIDDEVVQAKIRPQVQKLLKKQAREILLPRLEFLAKQHHFTYQKAKLSHASTRWGSCSSHGVISLNIGLVGLDNKLIDYVLIHELCHLRQMNHSAAFWAEVGAILPNYRELEIELKRFTPHV